MALQYHTKLDTGDIAPYVLLPGDPKRVATVASYWDESHLVADHREHVTYTGTYKGMPISCTSTGMGCPSTSIALEELAQVGATTFLRIGTCGTFQDFIKKFHVGYMVDLGGLGIGAVPHGLIKIGKGNGLAQIVGIGGIVQGKMKGDIVDVTLCKMLGAQVGCGTAADNKFAH